MRLREFDPSDCAALARLFRRTVHRSCSGDYSPEQLDVWAPEGVDLRAWGESLGAHRTVVAEEGGETIGFGDIDASGYLDRLFVREDWQRRGVASAICDELERAFTGGGRITTRASLTARPFFETRGYVVTGGCLVSRGGVVLPCFDMEKSVPPPS